MEHEYQEAKPRLETLIPEALFAYTADLDLAQNHAEVRAAAIKASREVSRETDGYAELMTYAAARLQETKGR